MAFNTLAALFVVFYYVTIVTIGVWAGRKVHTGDTREAYRRSARRNRDASELFLLRMYISERKVPLYLGFASMTATWVGGGYLNGAAEVVYSSGLMWCQAPASYALSLLLGGRLFASKMRASNAITMMDPFQERLGKWVCILLVIPAVCGEIFWTASILSALGTAVRIIVEIETTTFPIIASAAVILFYTSLGGFYSVIYTDLFQVAMTMVGLWTIVPYVLGHKDVGTVHGKDADWVGEVFFEDAGIAFDFFLMTALGGIPWQVYFQRVLSVSSSFDAEMMSYLAAVGCIFLALPPIMVGAAAKTTNFTLVGYKGPFQLRPDDVPSVLPICIRLFAPSFMSIVGLGAITSAVMSSMDSSMLSAATLVTRNVYHQLFRPTAGDMEIATFLRASVCVIGALSTYMALSVTSVYALWIFSSDLVYVLLFPQLVSVFYFEVRTVFHINYEHTNAYGSVCGFVLGALLRLISGEPSMGVPVLLRYPFYDEDTGQRFPFRTFCMFLSFTSLLLFSKLTEHLFHSGALAPHLDYWNCYPDLHPPPKEPEPDQPVNPIDVVPSNMESSVSSKKSSKEKPSKKKIPR
ncbi:high-affinity choline transporter 1-like isoform X3 [Ornithodoros turicata]|uniref:high-affinity choline transporter 1-like isoform X3 n=1 Tax=Ornithodoros turicata TaxID=34597 RepID=UPI0031386653